MAAHPIGTRVVRKSGYVVIKTANDRAPWAFEHRVVWEAIHGALPEGWKIHHIDGNKANNAPENLVACSSNEDHHRTYHADIARENGRRVGEWNRGKPKSPEHRARIADALRGKPKSAEHRAKLSAALTGKVQSPETVAKRRNRVQSPEEKARRAASMAKIRDTPEYQQAISDGLRRYRAKRKNGDE